jgi:hypothetical protein
MKSLVVKVFEAGRSLDSLSVFQQLDPWGTGNNPADLRESEAELRYELLDIDRGRGDDDLVFFSRARRL